MTIHLVCEQTCIIRVIWHYWFSCNHALRWISGFTIWKISDLDQWKKKITACNCWTVSIMLLSSEDESSPSHCAILLCRNPYNFIVWILSLCLLWYKDVLLRKNDASLEMWQRTEEKSRDGKICGLWTFVKLGLYSNLLLGAQTWEKDSTFRFPFTDIWYHLKE